MKLEKPLIFFDLEATGLNISNDRIVQIACVKVNPDGTREEKDRIINPTIPIPPETTEIHGIGDDDVKDKPTFRELAKALAEFFSGCDLAGYNIIRFDVPLLAQEFDRAGVDFDFTQCRFLDVSNIYQKLNPRDLSSCYKYYTGEELVDAHNANADNVATMKVLEKMIEKEEQVKDLDFMGLCEFSRRDNNIDLAGKFVRNDNGDPVYNFGKNKGMRVMDDISLCEWMIGKDFTSDTLKWARNFIDEYYSSEGHITYFD